MKLSKVLVNTLSFLAVAAVASLGSILYRLFDWADNLGKQKIGNGWALGIWGAYTTILLGVGEYYQFPRLQSLVLALPLGMAASLTLSLAYLGYMAFKHPQPAEYVPAVPGTTPWGAAARIVLSGLLVLGLFAGTIKGVTTAWDTAHNTMTAVEEPESATVGTTTLPIRSDEITVDQSLLNGTRTLACISAQQSAVDLAGVAELDQLLKKIDSGLMSYDATADSAFLDLSGEVFWTTASWLAAEVEALELLFELAAETL